MVMSTALVCTDNVMQRYYTKKCYYTYLPKVKGDNTDSVNDLVKRGITGLIEMPSDTSTLELGVALFTSDGENSYNHVAYYIGNGFAIESNVATKNYPSEGVRIIRADELNFTHYSYLNGIEYLGIYD